MKSQYFPSVEVASGVRRGCPLAPIRFAVCADVLLRKIALILDIDAQTSDDNCVCAFADDTAVTVVDVEASLPKLEAVFR